MFKSKWVGVVAAGLLLGYVTVASAESVFPSSVNETGPNPVSNIVGPTGAVFPSNFPVSSNETGPSDPHAPQVGRARIAANVGATGAATRRSFLGAPWRIPRGETPPFPSSVNETGPN